MIGKEILGYRVDEKIGSGGFGTVYKVSKTNAAGTYTRALKHVTLPTKKQYASVLNSMGGDYTKADDYFTGVLNDIVSEIRILSTLSESGIQNIVRYYENDIIETESPKSYDIYILMEYLTPFPDYFEQRQFTVRDVIGLGKDILSALISCHDKNIIHRDIKDDNIFVSPEGIYKLGDFGVSKALKDKSRAESVKGTPNFIAPEVYLGKEKYDNTVDLYSLGIVLYRLLNKSRNPFLPAFPAPYSTDDEDAAFEERMRGSVPELPVGAQNQLGNAVLKAIMPRDRRYDSAREFMQALIDVEKTLSEEELCEAVNLVAATAPNDPTASSDMSFQPGGAGAGNSAMTMSAGEAFRTGMFEGGNPDLTIAGHPGGREETMATPLPVAEPPAAVSQAEPVNTPAPEAPIRPETPTQNRAETETPAGTPSPARVSIDPADLPPQTPAYVSGDRPSVVTAAAKKGRNALIYASPFVIAAVYIAVYIFILPHFFIDKAFGLIDVLFTNPGVVAESLTNPSTYLNPIYFIIGIRIFGWLLVIAFFASLFLVGSTIQKNRPAVSRNAAMTGRAAHLTAMGLIDQIKEIGGSDVKAAQTAVSRVCERLKNETDFGSGSPAVIDCENEIAALLSAIENNIQGLRYPETVAQSTQTIETLCSRILGKLKMRVELKKK